MTSKKKSAPPDPVKMPWKVHFFRRHPGDDASSSVPARQFFDQCPPAVVQKFFAVIKAVANAPPPQFSGGGLWEAMHDEMAGYYEIRVDGPKRHHYRLFCLLDRDGAIVGLGGPSLVLVTGKDKPFRTVLTKADYEEVRALGTEFLSRSPRSIE